MTGKYTKPEVIDLNEQEGLGGDCANGSGDARWCYTGTQAGMFCNLGVGGTRPQ